MTSESARLVTLDHLGLLRLRGPDVRQFLQGQVTCDLRQLTATRLMHGAHCTPKGRMLANFDALAVAEDAIYLRLTRSAIPALLASLKKYIVFAKSTIEDISDQIQCLGLLAGDQGPDLTWPGLQSGDTSHPGDGIFYSRLDQQRLECWVPAGTRVPDQLQQLPSTDDNRCWRALDIESGRGWVEKETVEEFIPQQLNLQASAIAGISFTKGCYVGQEIVARMHYKGKSKRQMYRFHTATELSLRPNAPLFQAASEQSIGNVVNSVCSDGATQLLAVTTEEAVNSGNVFCNPDNPQKLERMSIPYAITSY